MVWHPGQRNDAGRSDPPGLSAGDLEDPQALSQAVRDIVALSTLPAIWASAEPLRIAESLAAALFATLDPEFVWVHFAPAGNRPAINVTQTGRYQRSPGISHELAEAIIEWSRTQDPDDLLFPDDSFGVGACQIITRPVGHYAEMGVLAAAFKGEANVTRFQHLFLNVAATQAQTSIQTSDLLISLRESERKLTELNETLERRVDERSRALEAEMLERQKMEQVLQQTRRLEAIGQLTGGVAHDFNNLLTIILGQSEFILSVTGNNRVGRMASSIRNAAERGARLTSQLLSFARKQQLRPEKVIVDELFRAISELIRGTISEAITLTVNTDPRLWPVIVDAAQFEAAVLNVIVNARDAMPNGGSLRIAARNVALGEATAQELDILAGEYVLLSVSDTGHGMSPEVQQRCFEPFFTTKDVGKGTGLGLSQTYGFARQSRGTATVRSTPGEGTTIFLYLPRADPHVTKHDPASAPIPGMDGQGKTVLLVEDQPEVREVIHGWLVEFGYRVITAADGVEAKKVFESDQQIDVLLTDVVMPNGVSGTDLALAARRTRPKLVTLLMSGYSREASIVKSDAFVFLEKPFRHTDLAAKLAEALAT